MLLTKLKNISSISALQFFQLFKYGALLLTGVVLAKSYLSIQEIGHYETFLFISSAVAYFWLSGLTRSFLPLNSDNPDKSNYFNAALLFQLFGIATGILILLLNRNLNFEIPDKYLYLVAAYVAISAPGNLIEYIYLLQKQTGKMIAYGVVSYGVQLTAITILLFLNYSLFSVFIILIIVAVLRYFLLIIILLKYAVFKINLIYIKSHLKTGFPLIISALLSDSAQYIDGVIVQSYFNKADFAIFRYGAKEFPLALLTANALSNAIVPQLTGKNLQEGLILLKKKSKQLMHLLFPISIALLISSKYIYPIAFNENFMASVPIFNIFLLLLIPRLLFPQSILIALKKTNTIMIVSAAELIVNVSASLVFLRFWGLPGIAGATLLAYFFEKIILSIILYKETKISILSYLDIKTHLVYSIVLIGVYIIVS